MRQVSVMIPAHNEAAWLPACLDAVLASDPLDYQMQVVVIANGCTDATAEVARDYEDRFKARDWDYCVLDLAAGGKLNAWNAGELEATGDLLIYLDADVLVSPPLIERIATALDCDQPRYASGWPRVTTDHSAVTRHYTRFWCTTPFMVHGVPGFGIFAMNRAGRTRWGAWPNIISDDTFARLQFKPEERIAVKAPYDWPMIEGFARLVQVRRRQDIGVAEIEAHYPELMANEDNHLRTKPIWQRALRDPVAFVVFGAVRLTIHLPILKSKNPWVRGR